MNIQEKHRAEDMVVNKFSANTPLTDMKNIIEQLQKESRSWPTFSTGIPYVDELIAAPIIHVCFQHRLRPGELRCKHCGFHIPQNGAGGTLQEDGTFLLFHPQVSSFIYRSELRRRIVRTVYSNDNPMTRFLL